MISAGLSSLDDEVVTEQPGESSEQQISDSHTMMNDTINSGMEILDSFDPGSDAFDLYDPLLDPSNPELWLSGQGFDDGIPPASQGS